MALVANKADLETKRKVFAEVLYLNNKTSFFHYNYNDFIDFKYFQQKNIYTES